MPWPVRTNYRGDKLPTAVGIIFPAALLFYIPWLAGITDKGYAGLFDFGIQANRLWAALFAGAAIVSFLGLLDDIYGGGAEKGFRGHISALLKGRLTTGMVKALGGGLVALAVAWWVPVSLSPAQIIMDALIIALFINVFNLLDLRPGRALKVYFIAFAIVAGFGLYYQNPVIYPYSVPILAAAVGLFSGDLRGHFMLGDAGSNVLGVSIGITIVAVAGPIVKALALLMLLFLNSASEWWSFTKIIEAVPPLRWFDNIGRPN
ncbi:MAG: hypothetical protein ABH838_02530 [Actinomycetota bacterium]